MSLISCKGVLFILPIIGLSLANPFIIIIEEKRNIDNKKLANGPAETVKALDNIVALLKWFKLLIELSFCWVNELGSRSPSNFTKPPKGSRQNFHKTPVLSLYQNNFGPKPILNSFTPIPHLFPI